MLEMLTDYDYTIDYTSDGDPETWGVEAGHGIISARQMLAWVEANCAESCPGDTAPGAYDWVLIACQLPGERVLGCVHCFS